MFTDFALSSPQDPLEADVCIIGAGAAGLTLATELCRTTSARVVLVESGSFQLDAATQQLYAGESRGTFLERKKNLYLSSSRLRFFGGTTNHWTGWVYPFDEIDFEDRDWVAHSGWPFGRAVLNPYYERARRFLKLPVLVQSDIPSPEQTPSILNGEADFQERIFQICPRRLGLELREDLAAQPNLSILVNANVLGIYSDSRRSAVTHVRLKSLNGREGELRARFFVLASGGIENARLLLASTDKDPKGLGNRHDLVGRFFSDHPHVPIAYLAMSKTPLAKRYREAYFESLGFNLLSVLHLKPEASRREKLLNCTVQLQNMKRPSLPEEIQRLGLALARGGQPTGGKISEEDILSVFMRLEQSPNPESRVQLSADRDALGMPRAKLDWQVGLADLENARRTVAVLMRNLGQLGIGRVLSRLDAGIPWPLNARGGNHHMGTTRMHVDPTRGVVDSDCRLHERENLFVAGSSVFTTSSAVNPTLTIIALALRLAEHLKGILK